MWFNRLIPALLGAVVSTAMADIYQWQWVDPADHSLGKVQSSILCPDGAGRIARPGSVFGSLNLNQAYLYSYDLSYSSWYSTNLADAYFSKANLYQMLIYQCSAPNADFTQVDAHTTNFRFSDLTGADFTDANLQAAKLDYCKLDNVNFTRADLSNGSMVGSSFHNANFTDANIGGVHFNGAASAGFTQAELRSTASYKNRDLRRIWFGGQDDLAGWDFSAMDLSSAQFPHGDLTGARFNAATLTYTGFLNATLKSTDFSDAWMHGTSLEATDASAANFSRADLTNANASGVHWAGANLTDAIISGTNMGGAFDLTAQQLYSTASYKFRDLRGTKLNYMNMSGWSFHGVDLTDAQLEFSNLTGADFSSAILSGTGLYTCRIHDADFGGVDLSSTRLSWSDLRGSRGVALDNTKDSGIILPDGTYDGFSSDFAFLRVWNYLGAKAIPIQITQDVHRPFRITIDLDRNPWRSTIAFKPGINVDFESTSLVVEFEEGVDPAQFLGDTFWIFDWTGVDPVGRFDFYSYQDYRWDISHLYTDGTVTLISVPEPAASVVAAALSFATLGASRRLRRGY